MDLKLVKRDIEDNPDFDEKYKRSLQREVEQFLLKKPHFNTLDDLLEWKTDLWAFQYNQDIRIRLLFDNYLSSDEEENFIDTVILNPYIPNVPFFNQTVLLLSRGDVLYGGARGGGKSDSALMCALQYVDFPEWSVGIFRLTYKDLITPGAILSRAEQWLDKNRLLEKAGIAPKYSRTKNIFTFPSGANIMFAQVQYDNDAEHYQGAELHKMIIDEAVQFSEYKINRLKGSIRKNVDDPLPTEILYTGNPGGISTEYFRSNFVEGDGQFIDSKYIDNCYLNFEDYEKRVFEELKDSDPVLYEQWKNGNWKVAYSGSMFKPEWFKRYSSVDERVINRLRSWDMAGTDPVDPTGGNDPDYTVGTLLLKGESGRIYVDDMVILRENPDVVEDTILNIAKMDGKSTNIVIEQEGGSQAKSYMQYIQRRLQGYSFDEVNNRVHKTERAKPMVSAIKFGNMKFRAGTEWFSTMLNQVTMFPTKGVHDDCVDSLSLGYNYINGLGENPSISQTVDNSKFIRWNNII